MVLVFAVITVLSTFAGGVFALHQAKRMHLVLGFTAGVVLGVVAFDLLPEVFQLSGDLTVGVPAAMLTFIAGFMVLHVVERALALHHGHEGAYGEHRHPQVGIISAAGLAAHSAMDGLALGLAAQAGGATLAVVALAVIAHDFSDGINTVGIMTTHGNSSKRTKWMLVADSLAPLVGAASTLFFEIPDRVLGLYLGFFAGFLLYIATSDILPEAHSRVPSKATFLFTFLGLGFTWAVVSAL
ncbi:MAG: permease [Frankiales bacterium]|nr:permease [Frankiales bacterium]